MNGLGGLLLVFFGLQMAIVYGLVYFVQSLQVASNSDIISNIESLLNGVVSATVFFLAGWIYCIMTRRSIARLFPFERAGVKYIIILSIIGLAVTLMSNLVVDALSNVFGLFGIENRGIDMAEDGSLPSILLYYLTVAVLPAFAEEFAFRGVVMGTLRKYSDSLALLVSSAAFALMHGNFVQIPFTFCCGLVFGYLVIKTNSLLPAIIVHFLNNALSVTADLLTTYEIVPDYIVYAGYGVIFAICGVLALIFFKKLSQTDPDLFRLREKDTTIPFRDKVKAAASSPTMIAFAVLMILYAIYVLIMPYINV